MMTFMSNTIRTMAAIPATPTKGQTMSGTAPRVTPAPCGRRIAIGEEVVLRHDTIYCDACARLLPPLLATAIPDRRFHLERGALCGGGSPLD